MSCFIVPLVQAIGTTIYRKAAGESIHSPEANNLKRNIPALELMLWGGTVMLIVDHIINGELTWAFPFLTALGKDGGGWSTVLHEILTVGVPMSLAITAVWTVWAVMRGKKRATA